MEVYRKINTVQAEQFDGSNSMCDKYRITKQPVKGNRRFVYNLMNLKESIQVVPGDWIVTEDVGERHVISDEVFAATYEEVI